MSLGIGIDTGGTYTDAVIYDYDTNQVLAAGKSPTTRHDLAIGIGKALDTLPAALLEQAQVVALSTTLATNACVEGKGGRARLVLMGTDKKTMHWIGADKKYGLHDEDVLCVNTQGSFDGTVIKHPDWANVMAENTAFFSEAESLSVAELNAMHNGGICEQVARDALTAQFDVPFVMASELVSGLNVMERGATALLNARLLPVVAEFIQAVNKALSARKLRAQRVIVRSDGSLMVEELARTRPVETILSGPAASVIGCRALANCTDALIADMGGTTTDISLLRGGSPQMTGGIRIGGWRTQIKGVFIDTIGLGGDTRLYLADRRLTMDTRRVMPLCAGASQWPQIKDDLKWLLDQKKSHTQPLHEFLYLVSAPKNMEHYNSAEQNIINALLDGPQMIGGTKLDLYHLDTERLEREGVVMRIGLTPTDIMHIKGDFCQFDGEASRLGARYFIWTMPGYTDTEESLQAFCDAVYEQVERRLYDNIARVLIETAYPDIYAAGLDANMQSLIDRKWQNRDKAEDDSFFSLKLDARAALVGIGAPIHLFLPEVAKALGMRCIIPQHSGVANAIGAVAADVRVTSSVEIRTSVSADGEFGYSIHAADRMQSFEEMDDAIQAAKETARKLAVQEARRRGAMGELQVDVRVNAHRAKDRDGIEIDLGTTVTATATGRLGA